MLKRSIVLPVLIIPIDTMSRASLSAASRIPDPIQKLLANSIKKLLLQQSRVKGTSGGGGGKPASQWKPALSRKRSRRVGKINYNRRRVCVLRERRLEKRSGNTGPTGRMSGVGVTDNWQQQVGRFNQISRTRRQWQALVNARLVRISRRHMAGNMSGVVKWKISCWQLFSGQFPEFTQTMQAN